MGQRGKAEKRENGERGEILVSCHAKHTAEYYLVVSLRLASAELREFWGGSRTHEGRGIAARSIQSLHEVYASEGREGISVTAAFTFGIK